MRHTPLLLARRRVPRRRRAPGPAALRPARADAAAEEPQPPPMPREVNDDQRQARNWPEQPPVIPHTIQGYQITLNANKCLTCHGRAVHRPVSQAPMISVTHFMDRDLQTLGRRLAAPLLLHPVPRAADWRSKPAGREPCSSTSTP